MGGLADIDPLVVVERRVRRGRAEQRGHVLLRAGPGHELLQLVGVDPVAAEHARGLDHTAGGQQEREAGVGQAEARRTRGSPDRRDAAIDAIGPASYVLPVRVTLSSACQSRRDWDGDARPVRPQAA